MTQQHIEEFLKYASPRLDYIGHCMEKQALSAKTLLSAIEKFRALDPSKQKLYSGQLKQIDDALSGSKKLTEKNVAAVLNKRRSDLKLNKPKVPSDSSPSSSKSEFKYGDLFDADTAGTDYIAHLKTLGNASKDAKKPYIDTFKSGFLSDPRVTQEAARRGITPDALFDEVAKYYASGFRGTPGANARGLRRLFDDATGGAYYNYTSSPLAPITEWTKAHPYLTAAGTTAGGSAFGTGLGYMLGNSSGSEETAQKLHNYYAINEALRRNALRSANSDILSRLANIFGAGDLNDLIG